MTEPEKTVSSGPSTRVALIVLALGGLALGAAMAYVTIVLGTNNSLASNALGNLSADSPGVTLDESAPDFVAETPDGELMRLSDLKGSIVALNFWATWCAPCKEEMPELEAAAKRYSDEHVVILGVNAGEQPAQVKNYLSQLGLDFQTVLDQNGSIVDQYSIRAFPTTIWIDAEGIVRARHIGALTADYIDGYVADLAGR